MFKKITIITLFCLSSLIQAEFQQSWQEDMRDYLSKKLFAETIQNTLKNPNLSRVVAEALIERDIQLSIQEYTKLRAEEFLKENIKNDHLLIIIEHMKKKYNFSDDVFFKKESDYISDGRYNGDHRIIYLNEKNLVLERKVSLVCLMFVLLHEIGHLRQHEKLGLFNFSQEIKFKLKNLEVDADRFAMSLFCKKCRQELKKDIIEYLYPWMMIEKNSVQLNFFHENLRKGSITLGFQSEQDARKKIDQIGKKGLSKVTSKLCDRLNKKMEKLFEEMKNKKIISDEVCRPTKDYLSKEEFLKELDSLETEECLCCKFIGQKNLHTVPTEL